MNKSGIISLNLLKRIDELLIDSHPYISLKDEVYYLGEYTNGKLAEHSPTNRLILNYKKEPKWKDHKSWYYKEKAIKDVAKMFSSSILQTCGFPERIKNALLVPIPPHAIKEDPEYDDRNLKMLQYFYPNGLIYELILQNESRDPLHNKKSKKRYPQELIDNYYINIPNEELKFKEIWLFDDILRHGTHFRAIQNLLIDSFPSAKIVGFFIARSIQHDES